ncbi:hypothetical protein K2Z83_06320 [Oscillochloris sp. ZM17-4]|uniref:peptidase MA family metallohydrolase n=1 Tax=Oscillochloris sp. ZM17-4 TaxID=2866714 RepID=UPI001C72E869|nr:hypothetical protein [Oscillochloris sp. ZM17-4]MBX0327294.1 hypothetical protein [Oscillochloris sp. ZM17-4]
MSRSIVLALMIALLSALLAPGAARAQPGEWRDRATATFTILYKAGEESEADRYAGFIDTIYDEVSTAFSYRAPPPLTLRLYPTSDDYYQANPAARNVPGIVAHADFRRRELVVIVERTRQQTEEEVRNNVRHELTHIVAADLSENRLNTGFQEGVAQYLERPAPELESKIASLRQAADQGRLLPWSAFDDRDAIYGAPEVGYPQSLSAVAFLVDRDGFVKLREFLTISARSSGYRSALERAYGISATDLEAEWLQWLPGYLAGGYTSSALDSYDLSYARGLLEQGNYPAAAVELEQALDWIARHADTQPAEVSAEAARLKAQADEGVRATQIAEDSRRALEAGDYERAQQLIGQARLIFARIGDPRQDAALDVYEQRVLRGIAASEQLVQASELARGLRYPQARATADLAAQEFAALGDQLRLTNALALRRSLDTRQQIAGALLMAAGLAGALLSLIGRFFQRPAEVW